jgi:hypothetical protein
MCTALGIKLTLLKALKDFLNVDSCSTMSRIDWNNGLKVYNLFVVIKTCLDLQHCYLCRLITGMKYLSTVTK